MAIQRATDEANIRQRINTWVEALRTMDLEGVMLIYVARTRNGFTPLTRAQP
jgi:ketosteroid isomerase-like protein